jgi:hypothetical protein
MYLADPAIPEHGSPEKGFLKSDQELTGEGRISVK